MDKMVKARYVSECNMKNPSLYMAAAFAVPSIIIVFLCLANGIIINGDNSILFSDLSNIYADHLMGIKHLLWEKKSLIYNWNIGGGINYLPYILGNLNLTNIPVFITPDSIFQEMILITQIIRIGLAGVSCYLYLEKHFGSRRLKMIAFSSGYAVSGYSVCFIQTIAWYEAIILLPILVLLTEKLVKGEKTFYVRFIAVLVYTFFSSYYLGYMISVFLLLYIIAYAYKTDKKVFLSVVRLGLNGLMAVGLSAGFLLPTFSTILDSGEIADLKFTVKFGLGDILNQFFVDSFDTYLPEGRPLLYCGICIILLVVSYMVSDVPNRKERIVDVILLLAMLVFLISLPLYYAWHMFDCPNWFEGRFTFIIIFYIVTIGYRASENQLIYEYRNIVISALLMCGTFYFCTKCFPDIDKGTLIINYILIIVYSVICIAFQNKGRIAAVMLPTLMCTELLVNAVLCSKAMFAAEGCESYSFYKEFYDTNKSIVTYLEQSDTDFYRIEKDYYRRENDLDAAGGKGLSSFGTFYNVNFMSMLRAMGITGGQAGRYIGGTPVTDLILSVKYIISTNAYDPFYDSIGTMNGKAIYKNAYRTGIGMLVNTEAVNIVASQYENPIEFQNAIARGLVDNNVENVFYPDEQCEINVVNLVEMASKDSRTRLFKKEKDVDDAYIDIVAKKYENECLYAYIPDFAGDVTLSLNGMYINGFMGQKNKVINLEKDTLGSDYVVFRISLNDGILSIPDNCIYRLNIKKLEDWESNIRFASLESFSERCIQLNAKCDKEELLLLSIPFDDDWKVYINEEEQETFPVLQGLIGVKVGTGNNEIKIIFKPARMRAGLIISFTSALILFVILRKDTKKIRWSLGGKAGNENNN